MKSVRSQSDLLPRHFPDLKRLIQNIQLPDNQKQDGTSQYQTKVANNRKVGLISSNLLKQKSCSHRFQQPIILQKKSRHTEMRSARKIQNIEDVPRMEVSPKPMKQVRSVEKFQPIMIPTPDRKINLDHKITMSPKAPPSNKQQIQIHLQNLDKDCLKKLFKKIRSLTDDLHQTQMKNTALTTQIQFLRNNAKRIQQLQKQNIKLRLEIQKLKIDITNTSIRTIEKIVEIPVEVVRHVPVEKIVQIEVPKYIEGPEKIVERVVEVQVERKGQGHEISRQINRQVNRQTNRQTNRSINRQAKDIHSPDPHPYLQDPTQQPPHIPRHPSPYYQYPIYKNTPYPFEVPIQIPIAVPLPVYIEKPHFNNTSDTHGFYQQRETLTRSGEYSDLHKQNTMLNRQNESLHKEIDILKRHNQEKNRELETLIHGEMMGQPVLTRTEFTFTR